MIASDVIAEVAFEVRRQLAPKISVLDAVPLAQVYRKTLVTGLGGPLTVVARGHGGLDDDTYAVTSIDLRRGLACIWLHREAWRELPREVPRTRFTVAHELGHCALHADELDQLDTQAEPEHHDRLEREANLAASHILIPEEALRRLAQQRDGLGQALVAQRFGVSEMAAGRRIQDFLRSR